MIKGDIVLVLFPFTDLTGNKYRPAVVLASSTIDVTVCFVSSQLKWKEEHDLEINPTPSNGLKVISLVRVMKIMTIDNELVAGKLGVLDINEIENLNHSLVKVFSL